jgi:DNA modification methylase
MDNDSGMAVLAHREIKWHPAACIFPMLPDKELQELADDIAKHGQREPVVLFEGMILDGRNRWLACQMAQVEPIVKEFYGTKQEALSFVWSLNRTRRQLNQSQVAIADAERAKLDDAYAAELEAMRRSAPKGGRPKADEKPTQLIAPVSKDERTTDDKRAKAVGTNRTYIKAADSIVENRPDLAEKIKAGELTIPQAKTEMRREEKRQELNQKAEEVKQLVADEPLWQLLQMDVLEGLQSVIDNHAPARLIFTDPPYNIGINYGSHHDDSLPDTEFVAWCEKWIALCVECLADDGSLWLMINDKYAADFVIVGRKLGLHLRSWIKWYETFGLNCFNNFNKTSRHILYFVKDEKRFVFNEVAVLRPSDRQAKYGNTRAQPSGKILDDVWQIPRLIGTCNERIPDFPTQLPLELVARIVGVASDPGDLVMDPFNGSGTTGVAAIQQLRKYIGIELSAKFASIAQKRLAVSGSELRRYNETTSQEG